jgi:hypothetical protein
MGSAHRLRCADCQRYPRRRGTIAFGGLSPFLPSLLPLLVLLRDCLPRAAGLCADALSPVLSGCFSIGLFRCSLPALHSHTCFCFR